MRRSYHLLGQLYDAAVFSALELGVDADRGADVRTENSRDWRGRTLQLLRNGYGRLMYLEARMFSRSPTGMNLHIEAH